MEFLPWAIFAALVAGMLALDLGVFHRDNHEMDRREALIWSGVWIGLALIFNAGVYIFRGTEAGLEWTSGYLIEKSLSVDNIFVFLMIFSFFVVPPVLQRKVLFWGILGALVMRAALIGFAGVLLDQLHWMIYVFGGFLIYTAFRFLRSGDHVPDLNDNRLVKLARRVMPVTNVYVDDRFFVKIDAVRYMTPLFLVLLLIESSDLIFAVDSIPAIYAVTDDPFIVFTSNVFAILGLRSLYFVLAGYLGDLRYLKPALAAILAFVGSKMILADWVHMPALASLGVIVAILVTAIAASIMANRREAATMIQNSSRLQ